MINYYKFGGSLTFDHPSYVVRQADKDLYYYLKAGEYCFVLNSRQMGKSSLRVRVTRQLRNEGIFCAFVDLTLIGINVNQEQWYKSFSRLLLDGLELDEINLNLIWQEFQGLTEVQKLQQLIELILEKVTHKLVIFIDEIDSLIRIPFKDDFLALIRGCYNLRVDKIQYNHLCFCLLGVASPTDLIQDKITTPFNIGQSINLSGITFAEAKESLLQGLLQFNQPEILLQEILTWTGGQPFLTQKLCYLITEKSQDVNPNIEEIIQEYIIKDWESQDQPEHLRTIRDRLLINEQKALALLELYSQIFKSRIFANDTPEKITLRLTGIAVKHQGYLQIYNPIYRQIFNQKWIQKQLNKFRPYYQQINQWITYHRHPNYLLQGQSLTAALLWSKDKSLSKIDYEFLAASQGEQNRKENQILVEANQKAQQLIKRGGIIFGVTSLGAILIAITTTIYSQNQLNIAREGIRLEKAGIKAKTEFDQKQLDSLVSAMKAGQDLKKMLNSQSSLADYPTLSPISALLKILNEIQQINQLQGHQKGVKTVAFSPDSHLIITGSNDGRIKLWKANGQLLKTLNPSKNNSPINYVQFSSDGQLIAAGNMEGMLTFWTKEGKLIKTYEHGESIYTLNFSPDHTIIATAGRNGMIKIWDLKGNLLKTFSHKNSIYTLKFTPDGQEIITGDNQGMIIFWSLAGKPIKSIKAHGDVINNIALSFNGQLLASASVDKTVKIWTINGKLLKTLTGHTQSVHGVIFTPDNQRIVTGSLDKTIKLWTIKGQVENTLIGHEDSVYSINLSPDGNQLISGSEDRTIKLWKLTKDSPDLMQQGEEIIKIGLSKDGKMMIAGSLNGLVKIWNLDTKLSQQWTHQTTLVSSIDFNLDYRLLVLGKADGIITLINDQGTIKSLKGHQQEITSISISPDSNLIISTDETGIIKLWNKEGNLLKSIKSNQELINSLDISNDGKMFISGSQTGVIKLWTIKGILINTLNTHPESNIHRIKFSPDGQTFAVASPQGLITIWNQQKMLKQITTDTLDDLKAITFSSDGKMLAVAGSNGNIEFWKLQQNPTLLLTIEQSNSPVTSLNFTPDSQALIVGNSYGDIRVWTINLDQLLTQGCHWLKDYWIMNNSRQKTLPICQSIIRSNNKD